MNKPRTQNFLLRWTVLGAAGFLVLGTACVSRQNIRKSQSHYKMAVSLIRKCQFPSALSEFKVALKLRPSDPYLHHGLGLVYFQFKKYKLTLKHLKKALDLKPNLTAARVDLARTLIEIGRLPQALSELKKAENDLTYLHPENIHAHLGFAYYKQGKFKEAARHFSVSRKIKAKECLTAVYHGRSMYFLNQFSLASGLFESAKTWCEKSPPACAKPIFSPYFFAALSHHKMGQTAAARRSLQAFLSKAGLDSRYRKEALNLINQWGRTP